MMKFSSQLFLILPLAMGIGVAMAFQTAINAQLREQLHSPLQAALLSFFRYYRLSHYGVLPKCRETEFK